LSLRFAILVPKCGVVGNHDINNGAPNLSIKLPSRGRSARRHQAISEVYDRRMNGLPPTSQRRAAALQTARSPGYSMQCCRMPAAILIKPTKTTTSGSRRSPPAATRNDQPFVEHHAQIGRRAYQLRRAPGLHAVCRLVQPSLHKLSNGRRR
jgi:hypothetical protein